MGILVSTAVDLEVEGRRLKPAGELGARKSALVEGGQPIFRFRAQWSFPGWFVLIVFVFMGHAGLLYFLSSCRSEVGSGSLGRKIQGSGQ